MLIVSEAAKRHLLAHPGVEDLAHQVYNHHKKLGTLKPFTPLSLKFAEVVGYSECLQVERASDSDTILVQRRIGRNQWSRAVESPPVASNNVVIIVGNNDNLITAYVGDPAPREPWDKSMNDAQKSESVKWWRTHALCLQDGAVTTSMKYKEFCNNFT